MSIKMKRSKEQNDRIFHNEFLPHSKALYNFARHSLYYNNEDSEDLVQQTYLKAYQSIDLYIEGSNVKTWLFTILRNTFITEYRKRRKRPARVDYEKVIDYRGYSADGNLGSVTDEVMEAINELPPDYRIVVLLRDIEGFSYREITKIINSPVAVMRSRLHRGRKMIRNKLTKRKLQI